ncbi:hypothetical protein M6B38_191545 [Iris pallida]|uniref:Uncharacterized protein n=1 Tax=Iris pallida TaxID=29817 RepID=A0AAX6EFI7_IRIPA|nr:hypothetical protein M6B38_191545 [Iris pallida]
MEPLSPRSPSTPTSPRRHIHSSFPHYFYSTPANPSSDSLSAFVVLCESRLSESAPTPKSNSDTAAEFAFRSNRSVSFDAAFAEDIFRKGRLLPIDPQPATTSPLKPPPRLQYITNIRKSLRIRGLQAWTAAGRTRRKKDDDPFVVAVEKVTREDAPWCQLPRSRRPEVCETDDDEEVMRVKRKGIVERVKSAISTKDKRNNDVLLSKEESAWLIRKSSSSKYAGHGKLVGLARCTTVSRYRNTHYGSSLLACLGFK